MNAAHDVARSSPIRDHAVTLSASHDGKQVAVVIPTTRGTYETWIAASDRSGLRRGPMFPNADSTDPTWSPDDQWIAFERNGRDKDDGFRGQQGANRDGPVQIVIIDRDRSTVRTYYRTEYVAGNCPPGSFQKAIVVPWPRPPSLANLRC